MGGGIAWDNFRWLCQGDFGVVRRLIFSLESYLLLSLVDVGLRGDLFEGRGTYIDARSVNGRQFRLNNHLLRVCLRYIVDCALELLEEDLGEAALQRAVLLEALARLSLADQLNVLGELQGQYLLERGDRVLIVALLDLLLEALGVLLGFRHVGGIF